MSHEPKNAAAAILAIWNDREDSIAQVYERWYVSEHLPERLAVPGFLSARRYEAQRGSPRFFTFYEVQSPQVLASPEYLARLAAPSPLTREVMASFRNMIRTACWPTYRSPRTTVGGCVAVAYVDRPARIDGERLVGQAMRCELDLRVAAVQVWQAVEDPAHAATPEAKLRPGGDRRIEAAVVAEVLREEDGWALQSTFSAALRDSVLDGSGGDATPIRFNVYRLLGRWLAPGGPSERVGDSQA
jgi:hypothetical protein